MKPENNDFNFYEFVISIPPSLNPQCILLFIHNVLAQRNCYIQTSLLQNMVTLFIKVKNAYLDMFAPSIDVM